MYTKELNPIFLVFSVNLSTLILKIVAYFNSNSASVISDLLNDTADAIGSTLLLLGVYLMNRRVKNKVYYPFGISRAIYVFGLISVSVIGGVLFTIAVIRGLETLIQRIPVVSSSLSITAMVISLIINLILTIYTSYYYLSEKKKDPSIIGSLIDTLTDTLGNGVVVIALYTKSYVIDGFGSLFISIVLLVSAISIGYRYFILLIGRSPPKDDLLRIINAIITTPGVYDVNELRAVMLTENEYLVIAEIEIEGNLSVSMTEKLSVEIEERVKRAVPEVKFLASEFVARRDEPATYKRLLELIKKGK